MVTDFALFNPSSFCPYCTSTNAVALPRFLTPSLLQPEIEAVYTFGAYRPSTDKESCNWLSRSIREVKSGGNAPTAQTLGELTAHYCSHHCPRHRFEEIDFLIPMPAHPQRTHTRGYSLPLIVTTHLSLALNRKIATDVITLNREFQDLRKLSFEERQREVRDAFRVVEGIAIKGKPLMLVDDVLTYGTTLRELARTLRGAGARQLIALAVAHTECS